MDSLCLLQETETDRTPFFVRGLNAAPTEGPYASSFGLNQAMPSGDAGDQQMSASGMEELCSSDDDGGLWDAGHFTRDCVLPLLQLQAP